MDSADRSDSPQAVAESSSRHQWVDRTEKRGRGSAGAADTRGDLEVEDMLEDRDTGSPLAVRTDLNASGSDIEERVPATVQARLLLRECWLDSIFCSSSQIPSSEVAQREAWSC